MKKIIALFLIVIILSLTLFTLAREQSFENTESKVKGVQAEHNITVEEAYEKLQKGNALLLDVRTSSEFEEERITQSTNLSSYDDLDLENAYIVYCRIGTRSVTALQEMKELGFREVYNMLGGIEKWKYSGFPTE
jgi:rhodanese-related sulfurtransferase